MIDLYSRVNVGTKVVVLPMGGQNPAPGYGTGARAATAFGRFY